MANGNGEDIGRLRFTISQVMQVVIGVATVMMTYMDLKAGQETINVRMQNFERRIDQLERKVEAQAAR